MLTRFVAAPTGTSVRFAALGAQRPARAHTRRFLIARARARRASSRSRAPRIASRPARRRSLFRRALPPRVMANVRHVPTVPFAASAMEGAVRKRATLSDTENLAVGAFGGVLETCIQSTSRSRSRARVSASTPLPLARLGSGVSSPRGTRVAPGRASPPPSAPSTCGLRTPDPEAFGVARAFNQSDLSPKIPRVASSRSCPPRRRDDKSQCP